MIKHPNQNLVLSGCFSLVLLLLIQSCDVFLGDTERENLNAELEDVINTATNGQGKSSLLALDGTDLSLLPADPNNPLTPVKVELGKFLFHDTRLGHNSFKEEGQYSYSCASCHHSKAGFQSGIRQGIGEGGLGFGTIGELRRRDPEYDENEISVGFIRAPSILNVAYQSVLGWDGRYGAGGDNAATSSSWSIQDGSIVNELGYVGVESQAIAAMQEYRMGVEAITGIQEYQQMFANAFPELDTNGIINDTTAALAIAAYERTVTTSEAPFQKWLRNDPLALTGDQLKGAILFFGKAQCSTCHSGPGLSDGKFHALGFNSLSGVGIVEDSFNQQRLERGRGRFTGDETEEFKFKTPQLYNLKDPLLFGHGASFFALKDLIRYKNSAVAENPAALSNISDQFTALSLSTEEINQLASFIQDALYDGNLRRHATKDVPSGDCVPNNDIRSKEDLDCRIW